MKILHFTPSCFPENLGTSRRLKQLLYRDHNTHYFVAPVFPGAVPDSAWKRNDNFLVKRCRYFFRLPPEIPIVSRYLKVALNSRKMAETSPPVSPDVVHAHTPLDCALAARLFARNNRLPLIYEIHTLYVDEVAHLKIGGVPDILNRMAKRIARWREAEIIKASRSVIVQTESLRRRVVDLFRINPELVRVIPNGIDSEVFSPVSPECSREKLRRERGWKDKKIILYSGYLDRINGVDFLLTSAAGLREDIKRNIRIVLAGDGPLADSVRRQAEKDPSLFEYLGQASSAAMPSLYGAADIFVIPRPETDAGRNLVPIKLLEAMAMEKVVLVSDLDALGDVVGDNRFGIVFRKEDPDDFRKKLEMIINGFDTYSQMGMKARAEVISRYDWNRSRELLEELYCEIGGAFE
jgi:glycogen synthase